MKEKYIVIKDEETKLIMRLMKNTNESGRWRSSCDFSQGVVLLCIQEWSLLAGKIVQN